MRQDVQKAWDAAPEFRDIRYPGQGPGPEMIEPILREEEIVLCILKCMHTASRGKLTDKTLKCTAVVTDKEIYLIREGTFTKGFSKAVENIPVHTITGVEKVRQVGFGTVINISRAGNTDKLIMCNADQATVFLEFTREVIAKNLANKETIAVVQQGFDPLDQIKKLKELLDSGVITNEEFIEKKSKLLNQI